MKTRYVWAVAGVALGAAIAMVLSQATVGQPSARAAVIRPDVITQVETELARLDEQANAELTQVTPSPSRAVAFYLLAGLAASASPRKDVPKDERPIFGIDEAEGKFNGKLYAVAKDLRIAFVDKRLRDKSGWYVLRFATLYRHKDGTWVKQGWGHVIPAE